MPTGAEERLETMQPRVTKILQLPPTNGFKVKVNYLLGVSGKTQQSLESLELHTLSFLVIIPILFIFQVTRKTWHEKKEAVYEYRS